jgi:metallo-beta-lactamase family protein
MKPTQCTITFLGGAGTVTGSKMLLDVNGKKILIDCGLFQGLKELRLQNRAPFPIAPSQIDTLILTHAHLDHSGYIPLFVKNGFRGKIHCTHPTKDLTEIILLDSAKIQEEDAERATKYAYTHHKTAEPLYTTLDVINAMKHFISWDYNDYIQLSETVNFQFLNNGHILGSSFVKLNVNDKQILFSGDIGRKISLLMYPPKKIKSADYIILESTYGDRLHQDEDVKQTLLGIIEETIDRKGILMIPSFAVERAQEIIYILYQLKKEDKLPEIPIYLDSPMGVNSTEVYSRYGDWQKISHYEVSNMYEFVHFISDFRQSKAIVMDKHPKIVIAGSGMMEGGRILHYLNNHVENERNTLLFVGYQCEGTRGRSVLEGSDEIKFFGEYRKVKCQVRSITSLSAHGDQKDMLDWLKAFENPPKQVFINHGEPHQSDAFRVKIKHDLNWNVTVAKMNVPYELS